ncbi:MAG: helix-turn-helix domain-containing protein [Rhodocyclaceae bacterium]|nr:helix-turn-helix domain-containing protein [Rhodocyclaceae bacterium]
MATREEILKELGARLRAERLAQSLTQGALADMAGVSVGTVKTLERCGISSFETVIRIVQALGLTDQLQTLFDIPRRSIAQMEQAEHSRRLRAPKRALRERA